MNAKIENMVAEAFAIPVRENGKRKTFYTEVLPFVPGPGVEVLGEPVRMVAAQSAPGDRDVLDWLEAEISAVDTWYRGSPSYEHDAGWMKDQALRLVVEARAAWQRCQAARAPEGYAIVPVEPTPELFGRYLGRPLMNMDRKPFESWADEYRRIVAAAPAQPAAQDKVHCSECGLAVLDCDKRGCFGLAAAHDQGEVQRLREALEEIRHANMNGPVSESNAGCIKRIEQIAERALADHDEQSGG